MFRESGYLAVSTDPVGTNNTGVHYEICMWCRSVAVCYD